MAYDEALASRLRSMLEGMAGISEKRMMGSCCFFLDGNMIGAASREKSGEGQFLFRVGKDNQREALAREGAQLAELGGRKMSGFIFVPEDICDEQTLKEWISLALSFVNTLPAK